MQYIIYPHNGSADHGAEARLRSLLGQLASLPSPSPPARHAPPPI